MRIVFMGTPAFAVPALEKLIESRHEVVAVVTQPDRPVGRGKKITAPAVKTTALGHSIPVLQPEKIRKCGFDETLKAYAPDAIVVVAYGNILPTEVLQVPRFGCINIHASLLPKYRGAAPIQWAVINGERETGITIMQLDKGMDTGPIIAFENVDILDDDDVRSLSDALSVVGSNLLLTVLDRIEADGEVVSIAQNEAQATLAPMLEKSNGLIDWSMDTEMLICCIRGLQPWPTAFSFLHGHAWKFLKAVPFEDPQHLFFPKDDDSPSAHRDAAEEQGRVTSIIKGKGFTVRTGTGHLLVTQVQPQGKKPMSAADAINGKLVKKGDEFLSDPAFLEGTPDVE